MTRDRLVIGIGNPDRGDDAAGILVARGLQRTRAKELADCASLIDSWEGEADVVVVDAMRSGRPPGTVFRFEATSSRVPVRTVSTTHSLGLAETIELGRALGRLPGRLTVFGIEAEAFEHGSSMTDAVRDAVSAVVTAIEGERT